MGSIGLAVFASILGTSEAIADKTSALVAVINLFSAILLVTAVLILIFVNNDKKLTELSGNSGERTESEKFRFKDIGKLLKEQVRLLNGRNYIHGLLSILDSILHRWLSAIS